MLDETQPFIESVRVTLPWLQGRSIGGLLMTLGHLVFAGHFVALALGIGPARSGAVQLRPNPRPPCLMESGIKLITGAVVTMGIATASLVVLPYSHLLHLPQPPDQN